MDGEVHGGRGGVHTVWKGVGWTPEDFRSECWRDQEGASSSSAIRAHLGVPGKVETGESRSNSLRPHHVRLLQVRPPRLWSAIAGPAVMRFPVNTRLRLRRISEPVRQIVAIGEWLQSRTLARISRADGDLFIVLVAC